MLKFHYINKLLNFIKHYKCFNNEPSYHDTYRIIEEIADKFRLLELCRSKYKIANICQYNKFALYHRHSILKYDFSKNVSKPQIMRFRSWPTDAYISQNNNQLDIKQYLTKSEDKKNINKQYLNENRLPINNLSNINNNCNISYYLNGSCYINFPSIGYEYVEYLSEGSASELYIVTKNDCLYVAKVVDLCDNTSGYLPEDILLEAEIMKRLSHPNVINYEDSYIIDSYLIIIMEYCENGDLHEYLNNYKEAFISEDIVRKWILQICSGLEELHQKKILHCDIKTSNLFLDADMNIKVGDLGLAKITLGGTLTPSQVPKSTPIYMSPEMCAKLSISHQSDYWSLGCIIYEICVRKYAFPSLISHEHFDPSSYVISQDNESNYTLATMFKSFNTQKITKQSRQMLKNIDNDFKKLFRNTDLKNQRLLPPVYSKELNNLTAALLQPNPKDRPTFKKIVNLINNAP